jgi:hypothetical protein
MYHTREATNRHDKIYALLGMSLEGPSAAGLLSNYQVTWKESLQQLVEFLLCKEISVETWNEREMTVIKSKGCILGRVSLVESDSIRYDRQHMTVVFQNTSTSLEYKKKWGDRWTLQASAKSIRKGDAVCLLQGTSKPTIIRPCKGHFAVIVIAVPLRQRKYPLQQHIQSKYRFPRDFLLAWNWDESLLNSQCQASDETSIEISTLVPEYLMTASDKLKSLYNVAVILQDMKEYKVAGKRFQEIIEGYESTEQHLYKLAGMEIFALMHKEKWQWIEAEQLFLQIIQKRKESQETDHPDTLRSIASLASTYIDRSSDEDSTNYGEDSTNYDGDSTDNGELDQTMEDLLNRIKDNLPIPEKEVVQVTKSFFNMLPLLLDLKRSNVEITEEVVNEGALGSERVMTLLLV